MEGVVLDHISCQKRLTEWIQTEIAAHDINDVPNVRNRYKNVKDALLFLKANLDYALKLVVNVC
jgi:hypothetical protein